MTNNTDIPALRVRQWLTEWDKVVYDSATGKAKPQDHFYIFSISAKNLKSLSGVFRRSATEGKDRVGIQRSHEQDRSDEIKRFVQSGYPWSSLNPTKRESAEYDDLRKPGWLPTAIVVNILRADDKRRGVTLSSDDAIVIKDEESSNPIIRLPKSFVDHDWEPKQLPPIEVIDGQHRLWAFEDSDVEDAFEVPVVAFYGLDISWQAYLFYTINIKPKKINASLAYDMYPMLRTEDWLEKSDSTITYRESRAQELTETLWAHPKSPWHSRINMLGEPGFKGVSQSAWIHSLTATYIRSAENRKNNLGGLFGSLVGTDKMALPWTRAQQAAFLIAVWQLLKEQVRNTEQSWAIDLRLGKSVPKEGSNDPAFSGQHTLLNTDQGVRAVLFLTNDMCFINADTLRLADWTLPTGNARENDIETVSDALESFRNQPAHNFVREIASILSDYDWRTSAAPNLTDDIRTRKLAFRGSSGYRELRRQITKLVSEKSTLIGFVAMQVLSEAGLK